MGSLRISREASVVTVLIDRPEKRNALDAPTLEALHVFFETAPMKSDRVVLLRGRGSAFCAGLDLSEQHSGSRAGLPLLEKALAAIERYQIPVVAAVHGDALGGGTELALHCDFVVASRKARFGIPLAQVGTAANWFLLKKLIEIVGPVIAREIALVGEMVSADQMRALNAISRVCDDAEFEAALLSLVQSLVSNAPLSVRAMKATLVRLMAFREQIAHQDVDELWQLARNSRDAKEGIAARLQKRPAIFTGD